MELFMRKYCYVLMIFCVVLCVNVNAEITPSEPSSPTVSSPQAPSNPLIDRGRELFERQCASCHGTSGLGDGIGAYLLYPHPRDFSSGKFRLVTTVNHVPTKEDLFKTISRGMPGTSMPPWEHLSVDDRNALVHYVLYLSREGKIKRLMDKSKKKTRQKAEQTADRKLTPGDKIVLPEKFPISMESVAFGRRLYVAQCASCHGINGDGNGRDDLKDDDGYPIMPRDFTAGVFKGGAFNDDIAYRIRAGIPATPMPSFSDLTAKELWSLVYYVQSLANPTSLALVEQKKKKVAVARVDNELAPNMNHSIWNNSQPAYLSLLPLWWRKNVIKGVYVQALHNGKKMAVRMVWEDSTKNENVLDHSAFSDGAAVQFSGSDSPPFFAMGYSHDPVNIWNWKALREPEALKYQVVQNIQLNMPDDIYPSAGFVGEKALYSTARDLNNPSSELNPVTPMEDLNAGGFGTLTNQGPDSQNVSGVGKWADGFWEVIFVRDLSSDFKGDIKFVPGNAISVAFALWDGEFNDRNGQKVVTIWHKFVIGE